MRKKKRYSKIGTLKKGENDWRIKKKPTKKITFPFLIVLRGAIERMYTHFYIYVRRTELFTLNVQQELGLLRGDVKKVVVLGGAHHKIEDLPDTEK